MVLIYKLICFDFDGTLIEDTSIWQTLHDFYGTDKNVRKKAWDDFFSGKITYRQWVDHDIAMYVKGGADRKTLERAIKDVKKIPGADEVIEKLKKKGMKIAVISGSLDFFIEQKFHDAFDYVYVNRVIFDDEGKVAGWKATPFDMQHKADGLKLICRHEKIKPKDCVFVGDHFNDVEIAKLAGLSISFNSKVKELDLVCDHIVKKKDLREILKILKS